MSSLAVSSVGSRPPCQCTDTRNRSNELSRHEKALSRFAPVDELLLSDPGSGGSFDLTRINARVRSNTQLRVRDDGSVQLKSRTRLRYSYEFQAADGSKIAIKARANLNFSAQLDEDGNVQIRAKAKLQVSLLQESVNGEVDQLAGAEVVEGLLAALSDALPTFNDLVDQASSQFQNADSLNGDGLITDLVNAFNGLIEGLGSAETPEEPALESPVALDVVPDDSSPNLLTDVTDAPVVTEPIESPPVAEATVPTDVVVVDLQPVTIVPTEPPAIPEPTEPAGEDGQLVTPVEEPAALAQPVSVQSLRVKLRVRFTESLSQLVKVFDDGNDSQTQTLTKLRQDFSANLKLSARWTAADGSDPDIPALDASA